MRELLNPRDQEGSSTRIQPDKTLEEGWTLVERIYGKYGIDYNEFKRPDDMPNDKELLEEALYARMVERGLA